MSQMSSSIGQTSLSSSAPSSQHQQQQQKDATTGNGNNLERVKSGDRHHFMRQQLFTNNERWRSSAPPPPPPDVDSRDGLQQRRQAIKTFQKQQRPPNEHTTPPPRTPETATQEKTIHQNETINSYHNLHRNSSSPKQQANTTIPTTTTTTTTTTTHRHRIDVASLISGIAAVSSFYNTIALTTALVSTGTGTSSSNDYSTTTTTAATMAEANGRSGEDDNILPSRECHTSGSLTNIYDCNSNSNSNQLSAVMRLATEVTNFSQYNDVWLVKSWPEILLRVSFVLPIVLVGLLGNLMIIYSMCKFKTIRSKPTNMFILNMALADLLTTIVCPNAALFTDIYQFYVLGSFVCRFEGAVKITCLLVSAYSLIVLSFDWFLCVVKPFRTRITIKQTWLTLVFIWIMSISMSLPLLYFRRLRHRHWRDLDEVWCCELIEYSKYYWVGMTLFLIYLPTFVMTIVLVVILAQMDKFETKLKKTQQTSQSAAIIGNGCAGSTSSTNNNSTTMQAQAQMTNNSMTTTSASKPTTTSGPAPLTTTTTTTIATNTNAGAGRLSRGQNNNLNSSLSINMKYRRRIVKILFYYLITSIACWSPLQFVIVYRHFRSEAEFPSWFPELTFYSQLCATLSSAMNPIIFGFLSQPFRRVVTKSWIFCFVNKVWTSNHAKHNRSDNNNGKNNDNHYAMDVRRINNNMNMNNNNNNYNLHHINRNNLNYARSSQRITRDFEQPKLTLDYIEHEHQQLSGRVTTNGCGGGGGGGTAVGSANRRVSIISNSQQSNRNLTNHNNHHHHNHHHHHHHHHHNSRLNIDSFNGSLSNGSRIELVNNPNGLSSHNKQRSKIHRSHSSRLSQGGGGVDRDCNNNHNKRVLSNGGRQLSSKINTNGSELATGRENEAYVRDETCDDYETFEMQHGPLERIANLVKTTDLQTSQLV